MKVEQLRESVAALFFESGIYDERLFILSSNRALGLIFTDREVTSEAILDVDRPTPRMVFDSYVHGGHDAESFPIEGVAYSFRASGRGLYTVKDKSGSITREISGDGGIYRGFISGEGSISFHGDYRYTVYSLALFDSLVSPDAADIPIAYPEYEIDLPGRIPNFLAIASLPYGKDGRAVRGARIVGSKLYLPRDVTGEIRLLYRRSPKRIVSDSKEDIDVPRECECLLPLLTASFMWIDDDAEVAQYYMALYKNALATVRGELTYRLDQGYTTNGWA